MKKLLALSLGVALGAATLTATPQSAKADGGIFLGGLALGYVLGNHFPVSKWHHSHHSWHGRSSNSHVAWCESQYRTYDRYTNLYYYKRGQQRHCVSPYS